MAVALGRIAYTKISRRHGPELSYASTALNANAVPTEDADAKSAAAAALTDDAHPESETDKEEILVAEQELLAEATSDHNALTNTPSNNSSNAIAIFPQYLTTGLTTLIIREASVPHFQGSFSVSLADSETSIFHITREIPSFRHKQNVIDARTNLQIMTIRRNAGTLPRSFWFEDPTGKKICDVQGEFFVPFTGAKSKALFKNAAAVDSAVERAGVTELCMQGSYRNRHAEIKDKSSGQMVATVRCNLWNQRFLAGGRRTYVASVRAGVDMAVVAGMITALDTRTD